CSPPQTAGASCMACRCARTTKTAAPGTATRRPMGPGVRANANSIGEAKASLFRRGAFPMATAPTGEQILEGLYTVLNSLAVLHALGCSEDLTACETLGSRVGQLAGLLATQLAAHCSDFPDYISHSAPLGWRSWYFLRDIF